MGIEYLYKGSLSEDTARSVYDAMKRYPYPLELKEYPGARMPKLPEHPIMREDCMGGEYASTSQMWCLVHKDFYNQSAGCFLFLYSPEERQTVLDAIPDLVVNKDPFQTTIKIG